MSDTQAAMREFRFLDEKRKVSGLSAQEEQRWLSLRTALGIPDPQAYAPPMGYYGQDGNWYPLDPQTAAQYGYGYSYPQAPYDPNAQQGYDPNAQGYDPNGYYDPNQAAYYAQQPYPAPGYGAPGYAENAGWDPAQTGEYGQPGGEPYNYEAYYAQQQAYAQPVQPAEAWPAYDSSPPPQSGQPPFEPSPGDDAALSLALDGALGGVDTPQSSDDAFPPLAAEAPAAPEPELEFEALAPTPSTVPDSVDLGSPDHWTDPRAPVATPPQAFADEHPAATVPAAVEAAGPEVDPDVDFVEADEVNEVSEAAPSGEAAEADTAELAANSAEDTGGWEPNLPSLSAAEEGAAPPFDENTQRIELEETPSAESAFELETVVEPLPMDALQASQPDLEAAPLAPAASDAALDADATAEAPVDFGPEPTLASPPEPSADAEADAWAAAPLLPEPSTPPAQEADGWIDLEAQGPPSTEAPPQPRHPEHEPVTEPFQSAAHGVVPEAAPEPVPEAPLIELSELDAHPVSEESELPPGDDTVPLATNADFLDSPELRGAGEAFAPLPSNADGLSLDGDDPVPLATNADFLDSPELRGAGEAFAPLPSNADGLSLDTADAGYLSTPSVDDAPFPPPASTGAAAPEPAPDFLAPPTDFLAAPELPPPPREAPVAPSAPEPNLESAPSPDWSDWQETEATPAPPLPPPAAPAPAAVVAAAPKLAVAPAPAPTPAPDSNRFAPSNGGIPVLSAAPARPASPAAAAAPGGGEESEESLSEIALVEDDEADTDELGVDRSRLQLGGNHLLGASFVEGEHRVIIHTVEGQVMRGTVRDLDLMDDTVLLEPQAGAVERFPASRIKAIFFMLQPGAKQPPAEGSKIRVTFHDGRQLAGFTSDYRPQEPGFFLVPADARTNTERVYIYRSSVQSVAMG